MDYQLSKAFNESDHPRSENGRFTSKGNKKKFSDLTELEKRQKALRIRNVIVSSIRKNSVLYNEELSFAGNAQKWIRNNPQSNAKTSIGEIIVNEKSIVKDLYHGIKDDLHLKLQTLPTIKDVLEKGTYLGYEKDFEGKPIDNHYFAGKIEYGNEEKIIFCRVRENQGDVKRFYVHEVFVEDEIKKEISKRTSNDNSLRLTGKPLYRYILQDVLKVNGEALQKALYLYKHADYERRKEAYLDKLGRGYIAYLKKYYPELL